MFWEQSFTSSESSLLNLLDKDDISLNQLLKEDDLVQECKAQCTKLINFLQKINVLTQLVDYVVTSPLAILPQKPYAVYGNSSETKEDEALYHPSRISCEILTTENEAIYFGVLNNVLIIEKLLNYFENPITRCSTLLKETKTDFDETSNKSLLNNSTNNENCPTSLNSNANLSNGQITQNVHDSKFYIDVDTNLYNAQNNQTSINNSPIESQLYEEDIDNNDLSNNGKQIKSETNLIIESDFGTSQTQLFNQIDPKIANLASRTFIHLISRAPETVLSHLGKRSKFLLSLNTHLENSSFIDLIVHLSSKLETERDLTLFSEWFVSEDYIQNLLTYLHPMHDPVVHDNVATVFIEIYKNSTSFDFLQPGNFPSQPMPLVKDMTSKRTISTLLHYIFIRPDEDPAFQPKDCNVESCITNSLRIFLTILESLVFNQLEEDEKSNNATTLSMNKTYDVTLPSPLCVPNLPVETNDSIPQEDQLVHDLNESDSPNSPPCQVVLETGPVNSIEAGDASSLLPKPMIDNDKGQETLPLQNQDPCSNSSTPAKMESEDSGVQEEEDVPCSALEELAGTLESFHCYLENPDKYIKFGEKCEAEEQPVLITTIDAAIGGHLKRFGRIRYMVCQVISLFLVSNDYAILRQLHEFDTLGLLMKYFFAYPWNSLLHTLCVRACNTLLANLCLPPNQIAFGSIHSLRGSLSPPKQAAEPSPPPVTNKFKPHAKLRSFRTFASPPPNPDTENSSFPPCDKLEIGGQDLCNASSSLEDIVLGGYQNVNFAILQQLFIENQLLETIMDAWQDNEDAEILKHPRRAYMGHLVEMANLINSHIGLNEKTWNEPTYNTSLNDSKTPNKCDEPKSAGPVDTTLTDNTAEPVVDDPQIITGTGDNSMETTLPQLHPLLQGIDPEVLCRWVEFSRGPLATVNELNGIGPVEIETSRHDSFSFNPADNYFNDSYLEEMGKCSIDNYQYEEDEPDEKADDKFYFFTPGPNGGKYEIEYPDPSPVDMEEEDAEDEAIFEQMCRGRNTSPFTVNQPSDASGRQDESNPSSTPNAHDKCFEKYEANNSNELFFASTVKAKDKDRITPPRRNCTLGPLVISPTKTTGEPPRSPNLSKSTSSNIGDAVRNIRSRVHFGVHNKTASYDDLTLRHEDVIEDVTTSTPEPDEECDWMSGDLKSIADEDFGQASPPANTNQRMTSTPERCNSPESSKDSNVPTVPQVANTSTNFAFFDDSSQCENHLSSSTFDQNQNSSQDNDPWATGVSNTLDQNFGTFDDGPADWPVQMSSTASSDEIIMFNGISCHADRGPDKSGDAKEDFGKSGIANDCDWDDNFGLTSPPDAVKHSINDTPLVDNLYESSVISNGNSIDGSIKSLSCPQNTKEQTLKNEAGDIF